MTASHKLRLAMLFLVLGCTVGCDQASKHIARLELSQLGSVALPGGLGEFRLAENPGSFLSLGALYPQSLQLAFFTIGTGVGLVVLLIYLVGHARIDWAPFVGLALVSAGGLSNLIDRLTRQGFVTDFIFVRVGPLHTGIFNLADVAIVIGIATVACTLGKRKTS
jgi:signal peptidase II